MEVSVNIDEVEEFILSDDFREFILDKLEFGNAAFVLQTMIDKIDELKRRQNNGRNFPT